MGNVTIFGDWADAYDARVVYSEKILDQMVEDAGYSITSMVLASTTKAFMSFSQGFVDMGRLGNGVLLEGGWKGAGKDVLRAVSIVGVGGAAVGRAGGLLQSAQVGPTCVWTSAANSITWTGQRFAVTVESLARGVGFTAEQIGGLGRAVQITKIQQALTALGIRYRVLSAAGRSIEEGINIIKSNTGGVVNLSLRLVKAGKDAGGHRLYATFSRATGLVIKDANFPAKVFRSVGALRAHFHAAYSADSVLLSDSPILFIENSWLVGASHIAQRITEFANLAMPLIPEVHVTAGDPSTARQVVGIRTMMALGQPVPVQVNHTVAAGDSLWKLAEHYYHDGKKWPVIYAANRGIVGSNPDRLASGKQLKIPQSSTSS